MNLPDEDTDKVITVAEWYPIPKAELLPASAEKYGKSVTYQPSSEHHNTTIFSINFKKLNI